MLIIVSLVCATKQPATYLNLRKSAAKIENSPNESPLQYLMLDEYNLALRSMSLTMEEWKSHLVIQKWAQIKNKLSGGVGA